MKLAVILAIAITATSAWADSPKLAQARRAVEAVDYETAQRLLLEALHDGNNSPAALGEIYRLSARAAIVLDQRDIAEQYYRRWLAIDPGAALPGNTAPKLREPFVAAQAYIAAHGRLLARAQRAASGEIDVELVADPLSMARAAAPLDPGVRTSTLSPVVFGADHRARLTAGSRIAILDEHGNRLLELDVTTSATSTPSTAPTPRPASTPPASRAPVTVAVPETPSWTQHWVTWAIPTGVFGVVGAGFGVAALASYGRANEIIDRSGEHFLSDAEDNVRRGRTFMWITAGAGAAAIGCAIPAAIYFFRSRDARDRPRATVLPLAADRQLGLVISGRF